MGKSMDERLRWLIEYLKETGREEQAALLEEYDLEAYQIVITAKCLVCGLLQLATLEDGLDETCTGCGSNCWDYRVELEVCEQQDEEIVVAKGRECFGMFLPEVERKIRKSQKGKGK